MADVARRSSGCIWCRDPELTREHVLPQWLRKEIAVPPGAQLIGRNRIRQLDRVWDGKTFDLVSKSVCGACNNGWMSELEQRARLVLTRLLRPGPVLLDEVAQQVLADWAFKTACVFDQVILPASIPRRHVRAFYRTRHVPDGVRVFLAGRQLEDLESFGRGDSAAPAIAQLKLRRGAVAGTSIELYKAYVVLGSAFLQVLGFCNNAEVEEASTLVEGAIELSGRRKLQWPDGFPKIPPEALDAASSGSGGG